MNKVIIQIPCFNEAETLPATLAELPRELDGVDSVEWLVVDDGSIDDTAAVAKAHGVDHVVRHAANLGLARAFMSGLDACLRAGADIIVNTDADNQYRADDIPALIAPVLAKEAEMVVGERPIASTRHFSPLKKLLQRMGSWAVRLASGTRVPDAPSGFRAISRNCAFRLNVFNRYTYTLETIIQAGRSGMVVTSVPVRTNEDLRPSRLVRSIRSYVTRSLLTIVRIFMTYLPMPFFLLLGAVPFTAGFSIGVLWLYWKAADIGGDHVPALIAATILMLSGAMLWVVGLLGELQAANRRIMEDVQARVRRLDCDYPGHGRGNA